MVLGTVIAYSALLLLFNLLVDLLYAFLDPRVQVQ
jgi:ABC-type dipeptide/oligopeptide/nickel transport system permease component